MTNITIGRYDNATLTDLDGSERPLSTEWAGWIEGTRDDGSTWITFLNADGSPGLHYAKRDADGGVACDPVVLS